MYLAHISEDKKREQTNIKHLHGTAERAGQFASVFACRDWGYGCGLTHDIGKYTEEFQKRLRGGPKVDHATAGAKELFLKKNVMAAYCVAGHHSGLPDGGTTADTGGMATLQGRMNKELLDYRAFREEVVIPEFSPPPLCITGKGGFSVSFFIRMIFSCLVDADYLDTEEFMQNEEVERKCYETMSQMHRKLQDYIQPWLQEKTQHSVNEKRTEILKACIEKGKEEQGIFELTVPTGGGKTVSSLAFALEHAVLHKLDRIIYVIPYTSIIDQNAQVFRDIVGDDNVLEDHCNVSCENELQLKKWQLAAENWDMPIVVTTNVQFFESLFSNKSSKSRKLHNIANSVIIFDEAQMLPAEYLKPCLWSIHELVKNYRSTAVLCTATQPSLGKWFPEPVKIREICPQVQETYEFFRRTNVDCIGEISEEQLISFLKGKKQALCILNSRKRVQKIYEELEGEGVFHLSTIMYPKHRKRILKKIRAHLDAGQDCKVIATSLVEAGVDLDFSSVYRELAGVDSVVQAAGRCNREGRRSAKECRTIVFTFEKQEEIHLPSAIKLPIAVSEQIIRKHSDIASLEAIREYFRRLFHYKGEGLDVKKIIGQFENAAGVYALPFATVAEQFHLIENRTRSILITKEEEGKIIAEKLREKGGTRQLVRDAGQYCVNIYDKDFEAFNGAGMLEQLEMGLYVLRNEDQYSMEKGLVLDVSRGDAIFL